MFKFKPQLLTRIGWSLLVAALLILGWAINRQPPDQSPSIQTVKSPTGTNQSEHEPAIGTAISITTTRRPGNPERSAVFPNQNQSHEFSLDSIQAQEEIDTILISAGEDNNKALDLVAGFHKWPEASQLEAIRHSVNLLEDDHFLVLQGILLHPQTIQVILDTILDDLLQRPEEIKLPLLMEIGRRSDHPLQSEARELLAFYLEEDFGNDWIAWSEAMESWLVSGQ